MMPGSVCEGVVPPGGLGVAREVADVHVGDVGLAAVGEEDGAKGADGKHVYGTLDDEAPACACAHAHRQERDPH